MIQIIRGTCPLEAEQYRQTMLDLFCSSGTSVALRQYLRTALPNGDLRRQDKIEVYIQPGAE
eukprot:6097189-Prorocentrum_lima.AAC.1